jgi:hypothetical protein
MTFKKILKKKYNFINIFFFFFVDKSPDYNMKLKKMYDSQIKAY